jgi:hypothetical protein
MQCLLQAFQQVVVFLSRKVGKIRIFEKKSLSPSLNVSVTRERYSPNRASAVHPNSLLCQEGIAHGCFQL